MMNPGREDKWPLKQAWSFWVRKRSQQRYEHSEYEQNLEMVVTFNTVCTSEFHSFDIGKVKDFWLLHNHLAKPSEDQDYLFFREGVKPMWEVRLVVLRFANPGVTFVTDDLFQRLGHRPPNIVTTTLRQASLHLNSSFLFRLPFSIRCENSHYSHEDRDIDEWFPRIRRIYEVERLCFGYNKHPRLLVIGKICCWLCLAANSEFQTMKYAA